jgi:hypothetical protein
LMFLTNVFPLSISTPASLYFDCSGLFMFRNGIESLLE